VGLCVYGAAEIVTGEAEFLYTPTVSLEWTEAFLKQLVATKPGAIHVVIWDGAGFHHNEDKHEVPDSVCLLPLPAYSPELNPIEHLWNQVKLFIANQEWETVEKLRDAITEFLKPFWEDKERVMSLLGDTWLTQGVKEFIEDRKTVKIN